MRLTVAFFPQYVIISIVKYNFCGLVRQDTPRCAAPNAMPERHLNASRQTVSLGPA
ncbi:hypothetical protein NY78_2255 [Desulfovibrio sp. TomC]|nr:hypothetical protein NY78_2255 [Desulfovibrio sp. TomC]